MCSNIPSSTDTFRCVKILCRTADPTNVSIPESTRIGPTRSISQSHVSRVAPPASSKQSVPSTCM